MEDNPIKTKTCSRCKTEKPCESFNKCKSGRLGLHNHCRECQKIIKDAWQEKNSEHAKEYNRRPEVKARARKGAKERYSSDLEYREKLLEANRLRRRKEPAKIRQRENERLRRKHNLSYLIRGALNTRLSRALKGDGAKKIDEIQTLLGCSINEFIAYIESKWSPGMTWRNRGSSMDNWQLDHIIPCCAFNLSIEEDQRKCFHYTNYQPLWRTDNLKKGAKMPDGTDARVFNQTRLCQKIDEFTSSPTETQ